ncbi:DUF2975 domain-containing protein [Parabacteroides sp. APC149_11_2_Y6]
MKTRLNILTYLILLAFGLQMGYSLFYSWSDISSSFRRGYEKADRFSEKRFESGKKQNKDESLNSHWLTLRKNEAGPALIDSVYNAKTGKYAPASITGVLVEIPEEGTTGYSILICMLGMFLLPTIIVLVILFLKLINSVKSAAIFTYANIWRLRGMGICLLILGAVSVLGNYAGWLTATSLIDIPGYRITSQDIIEFSWFINAAVLFLAAEIFAMGLRMKEEQELTI